MEFKELDEIYNDNYTHVISIFNACDNYKYYVNSLYIDGLYKKEILERLVYNQKGGSYEDIKADIDNEGLFIKTPCFAVNPQVIRVYIKN